MRTSYHFIPPGGAGTRATLAAMRRVVRDSIAEPIVRQAALSIVGNTGTDSRAQVALIELFLQAHVAFIRDPRGVELLHTPEVLLTTIRQRGTVQGDCDDVAILAAALGLAIGLRARFVALGRKQYEHVFTVLGDPSSQAWWHLDTTRPFQEVPVEMLHNVLEVEV